MAPARGDDSKDSAEIGRILDGLVKDLDSDRADELCREHPELAEKIRAAVARPPRSKHATVAGPAAIDKTAMTNQGTASTGSSAWAVLIEQLKTRGAAHSRYKFEGEVARGGMGEIHKVFDEDVRRHLALKRIRMREDMSAETADELLGRFLEEAQVTGQLDHPGIVPVHEVGIDPEQNVYYTMKLVRGTDLRTVFDLARNGKDGWSITRAVGVLLKVCEAMSYAHAKGVIHRDLKPANVMVGNYGEVFVMDWGIARVMNREPEPVSAKKDKKDDRSSTIRTMRSQASAQAPSSAMATSFGEVLGTAEFMPPEQARGQLDKIGPPADIYAVGAMLYTLLAGHAPYLDLGPPADIVERLSRVVDGPPKSLADCECDAPAELIAICEKAMERSLADRYPSMDAFADDLRAYLEGRVVSAYSGGLFTYLQKWVARNKGLAATVAIALAVTAALSWWYWQEVKKKELEKQVEFERMADVGKLAELLDRQDQLWPVTERSVEALEQWLLDASALEARLPLHRQTLTDLDLQRAARQSGKPAPEVERKEAELERSLRYLVGGLSDLAAADEFGRTIKSVERRLKQATAARAVMIREGNRAWTDAIATIGDRTRSPAYGGLAIAQQVGLFPLGPDPSTGLWEFWHMASGERPKRDDATGRLMRSPNMGIVLVLLPAREIELGAADSAKTRQGIEKRDIAPPRKVKLPALFASKFEMTQSQWKIVTGSNPSTYAVENAPEDLRITPTHPVESVSKENCVAMLARVGLRLPSSDEWESACRGNRPPRGDEPIDANTSAGGAYVVTSPVGTFPPNDYGLFDMLGNVWEWCSDGFDLQTNGRPVDMSCGGGWADVEDEARETSREVEPPNVVDADLGVRPFRSVDP